MRARFPILPFTACLMAWVFLGLLSPFAHAYKCKPHGSPLQELQEATAVFVGKVTKVKELESVYLTEFTVDMYWKGSRKETITVRSGKHLYGYRFQSGQKYLVYASSVKDGLETSRCGRTKTLVAADVDLKELGEGKAPE